MLKHLHSLGSSVSSFPLSFLQRWPEEIPRQKGRDTHLPARSSHTHPAVGGQGVLPAASPTGPPQVTPPPLSPLPLRPRSPTRQPRAPPRDPPPRGKGRGRWGGEAFPAGGRTGDGAPVVTWPRSDVTPTPSRPIRAEPPSVPGRAAAPLRPSAAAPLGARLPPADAIVAGRGSSMR